MPPNDVVRHNLKVSEQVDWEGEPLPLPLISVAGIVTALAKPPVTTMISKDINKAPYRSVGKMTMRFDQRSSAATGWVVAKRAFITAGHCVYSKKRGGWITEASFCPRFNVECSVKVYKVEAVFTLQGWLDQNQTGDPSQSQYDMAACLVTKAFQQSKEPPLLFAVDSPATRYAAIGYPVKPIPSHEFNGKRMWQALGNRMYQNVIICAENNLTGGASGGPWCNPANKWVVSGLNSARVKEDPNLVASPVFGEGFQKLYDAVKDL